MLLNFPYAKLRNAHRHLYKVQKHRALIAGGKMKNLVLISLTLIMASCGPAGKLPSQEEIQNMNNGNPIRIQDVEIFDYTDKLSFSALPLQGDSRDQRKYWSGDYWPLSRGNINFRWNAYSENGMSRPSPGQLESYTMTQEELAELSPSEKFDLYLGRFDYPLTTEVKARVNPDAQYWEGICDGWGAASIHHNEPAPKALRNPDGILIPFGSSDIKALLSYYYAFHHDVPVTHQIGKRCNNNRRIFGWGTPEECKGDLNPGSFHLALANTIGLKRQSFLMDVKRYKEVWNQPVIAYESLVTDEDNTPSRKTTEGTTKVIRVETKVIYVNESEINSWYPIQGTENQIEAEARYEYLLYLNSSGEIIGGKWKSGERPDFIWRRPAVYNRSFKGLMQYLGALL